ncbi:MAG: flagellar biosynthesis anti-sigma factor FlgM [Thermoguttaceae bacterium]|nr:flagellar biosynthesis anti-sigma factor FlgM [Thermoguttaceae bacterium]
MQINGLNPLFGTQRINQTSPAQPVNGTAPASEPKVANTIQDDIRLSGVNNNADISAVSTASSVADTEGIRMDLVNRIRAEIAAGTYETEAKLDIALNRMLNELQGL